tara:strand:- start:803 stop:1177 length:375 start_codon:yes stop_codon:yes gene_type:complete
MSSTTNIPNEQLLYMRDIVTRQTDYDTETAMQKLKENNYDVLKVIREYMGSCHNLTPEEPIKSVNQQTFCEIRKMMDGAASRYRVKKELDKRREQIITHIQAQQAQQAQQGSGNLQTISETDTE